MLTKRSLARRALLHGAATSLLGMAVACSGSTPPAAAPAPTSNPEQDAMLALPATGGTLRQLGFTTAAVGSYGTPLYLSGHVDLHITGEDAAAQAVMTTLRAAFRLSPADELTVRQSSRDEKGRLFVRMQQRHRGMLVLHHEVAVQVDADGSLNTVLGELLPDIRLPETTPALTGAAALSRALTTLVADGAASSVKVHEAPTPVVFVRGAGHPAVLAYRALVEYEGRAGFALDEVVVQAEDGEVLDLFTQKFDALARSMFDYKKACLNPATLPGTVSRKEGEAPVADVTINKIYEGVGNTYYFHKFQNGRDSYDDKGAPLRSSAHVTFSTGLSCTPNNAAWLGTPYFQMVYGDGDGSLFVDLARGFDVSAHELTHAVTGSSSMLTYRNESGALNEAMSDIAGAAAEAWVKSGGGEMGNPTTYTPQMGTWTIGEEVAGPMLPGGALRFMNNPTLDMQSKDNYAERIMPGGPDNGGVHLNSGIANLVFFLMSEGGKHPRDKYPSQVKGIGIEKAQHIVYNVNAKLFTASTNFQAARLAMAKAAENLYGMCSAEWVTTHQAWDAVGVPGTWQLCVTPPGGF